VEFEPSHSTARCGKRPLGRYLHLFAEHDDPAIIQCSFLLIATWNDYEGRTAIENGTSRCSAAKS
jgi:hypothetical protein